MTFKTVLLNSLKRQLRVRPTDDLEETAINLGVTLNLLMVTQGVLPSEIAAMSVLSEHDVKMLGYHAYRTTREELMNEPR